MSESKNVQPVSELELAALSSAAMPSIQVRGIRGAMQSSDSGQWLSLVDALGDSWLSWAPAHAWSDKKEERFVRTTDFLKDAQADRKLPFETPVLEGEIRRNGGGTVMVFRHPGGAALTNENLSVAGLLPKSLGSSLAGFPELEGTEFARFCGQYADAERTRRALKQLVDRHVSAIPARLRSRWLDALSEDSLWVFQPVPLHGSLCSQDVYVAPGGAVLGIFGFDSAAVGDPAQDMAWLMLYASDSFLSSFESAYALARKSPDLHVLARATLLAELETLRWYARGVACEDREWRRAGVQALRDMDSEIGDHRLVPKRQEVVEIAFTVEEEPLMRLQQTEPGTGSGPRSRWQAQETEVIVPSAQSPRRIGLGGTQETAEDQEHATGAYDPFPHQSARSAGTHPTGAEPTWDSDQTGRLGQARSTDQTGSIEVP